MFFDNPVRLPGVDRPRPRPRPRPRLVPGVEGEPQKCTRTSSSVAKVLPGAYLEKSCVELGNCLRTPCLETTTKPSGFLETTEAVIVMTDTKVLKESASALLPVKTLPDTMAVAEVEGVICQNAPTGIEGSPRTRKSLQSPPPSYPAVCRPIFGSQVLAQVFPFPTDRFQQYSYGIVQGEAVERREREKFCRNNLLEDGNKSSMCRRYSRCFFAA